jgi:outer membrane protein
MTVNVKHTRLIPELLCLVFFLQTAKVFGENSEITSDFYSQPGTQLRARNQILEPVTIDEKYLDTKISGDNSKSSITLKGAIEKAIVSNKDVKGANLEVSRFKWDSLASKVERLPTLRAMSYLSENTLSSFIAPARPNAFVFLAAFVPVTQQYRIGLKAHVVSLAKEIATARLREHVNDVGAKVKEAYYRLVLDQSLLDDTRDSIRYLNELKTVVAGEVTHGDALKYEEMQVAAKLAKAQYEETKAQNTYGVDREKFNQLLGRDLKSNIELETVPPPDDTEINLAQAESTALARRPEIHEAEARIKQINYEKKVIMSEYIPNVNVGLIYIALPGFNNSILPRNTLAPGIFMNWNAWDWGRKVALAKGRNKEVQSAILNASTIREDVIIDLHTQLNRLSESRQLLSAAQLARTASREEMRVSLNRYKYTNAKLSDVLQAQSGLADANNNYHEALIAFWSAKAQFERAVGGNL